MVLICVLYRNNFLKAEMIANTYLHSILHGLDKLSFNFYFKKSPRDSHFYGTPVLICYKVIAPVKVLVNMDREIVCIPM